jgi:competence protein ComEC
LFRILLPFAIGILIGINGVISDLNIWKLFFLGLLFYVVLNFFLPKTIIGRNIEAVLIKLCFLCFGLLHVHLSNFSNQAAFIQPKLTNENLFCKVVSDPIHTKKSWKFFVELIGKSEQGDIFGCKSKVLVYIKDSVMKPNLEYGDYLLINSKLLTIKPPDLEGQFDYGNFLRSKNCFFQSFISSSDYKIVKYGDEFSIMKHAIAVQKSICNTIRLYLSSDQSVAVASALLAGFDDEIESELMTSYAATGTLHILSVSGMHVGVIYLLLAAIFGWLEKLKKWRWSYFVLIIVLIWFYAFISGFSASVLRAALMITLSLIGKWINGHTSISNTIAVSLFLILFYDPNLILNTGFQLSYLAILGIVLVHPVISGLLNVKAGIWSKIWELTSVSISAQMITFPISIYYFHQFPNYFILSNLIIIPISTLAIYLTLLVVVVSPINSLALVLGKWNTLLIDGLNTITIWFSSLPGAVLDGISFSFYKLIIIYLFILFLVLWLKYKKSLYLRYAFYLILLLQISSICNALVLRNQKEFFVYAAKNRHAISVLNGENQLFFAESKILLDAKIINAYYKPFWISKSIRNTKFVRLD